MKLKNTLGLAIMGLVKACIVRPVIEVDEGLVVVGKFFVKGIESPINYPEYLANDPHVSLRVQYYYQPIRINPKRLNRSILDEVEESQYLTKTRNLHRWLPDGRYMLMQLKMHWDNRNLGLSYNALGIPVKLFPKPVYTKGWV